MSSRSKVPTPDEIWKILKEVSAMQKASSKKNEEDFARIKVAHEEDYARIKATQEASSKKNEEDYARIKATQEETFQILQQNAKSMKKTERMIEKVGGRFNQRWGHLVESLVKGKLVKIFQDQNIDISHTQERSIAERKTSSGEIVKREIDIIVANGTEVVAVEVKTSLTRKDVDYFLEVLSNFKEFFPRYKNETLYGAVAYLKPESQADVLAEEKGLFIIRATGDSARLVNQTNFKPKVFA